VYPTVDSGLTITYTTVLLLLFYGRWMCIISETTLSGCVKHPTDTLIYFATAGQRIDPSRESTFVWRVTASDGSSEESVMSYTNWDAGQPDYSAGNQACMGLWSRLSYTWDDYPCSVAMCSVCEIDTGL